MSRHATLSCIRIINFKIFLAYKGAFGVDDTELYRTLALAKKLGVIVTAHCENETLVAERSAELLAAGKTGPGQHHESRPPLVEAEGVHHLLTFAELTGTATYISLFPRKGTIQPDADADLVVFDPDYRGTISAKAQLMNVDYSAFEGWKIEGRPSVVTVRGEIAARDGQFTGTIGRGNFLKRKPQYF